MGLAQLLDRQDDRREAEEAADRLGMRDGRVLRPRLLAIHAVPARIILLTFAMSLALVGLATVVAWPVWAVTLVAILPWVPLFGLEMAWTYRHYGWLALFLVLVVTQVGHSLEHVAQMVQIHALHLHGQEARGVFGNLDVEWVHLIWNSWVLLAVALLLYRYRRNPWLWVTACVAVWHEIEHMFIMVEYLRTGVAGTPGLLAKGGEIGGGLLARPDLHFLYNVVETTPLLIAFGYTLKRTYNSWLERAFPELPKQALAHATAGLIVRRMQPGSVLYTRGEAAHHVYVLVKGRIEVVDWGEGDAKTFQFGPGAVFGDREVLAGEPRSSSARAKTAVEVLALPEDHYRRLANIFAQPPEDPAEMASREQWGASIKRSYEHA